MSPLWPWPERLGVLMHAMTDAEMQTLAADFARGKLPQVRHAEMLMARVKQQHAQLSLLCLSAGLVSDCVADGLIVDSGQGLGGEVLQQLRDVLTDIDPDWAKEPDTDGPRTPEDEAAAQRVYAKVRERMHAKGYTWYRPEGGA